MRSRFGARRVGGHHDDGRHAEQLRCRGHALGVIAGGKRHNAAAPLLGRKRREFVVGAAELNEPVRCRVSALKDAPAGERVQNGRRDQWRMQGNAGEPHGRRVNIGRRW